jgi:hypothetical protein
MMVEGSWINVWPDRASGSNGVSAEYAAKTEENMAMKHDRILFIGDARLFRHESGILQRLILPIGL